MFVSLIASIPLLDNIKLSRYAKDYIKENFDENTIKLPSWVKKVIAEIKDSNEEQREEISKKLLS